MPGRRTRSKLRDTHVHMDLPGRLINHSCRANLGIRDNSMGAFDFYVVGSNGQGIRCGDELTFDYESSEFVSVSIPECMCGADGCRGRLKGFKHNGDKVLDLYGEQYIKKALAGPK